MSREEEIRTIAYGLWQADNCCDGRDVEHWLKAEAIWQERQKRATTEEPLGKKTTTRRKR